MKLTRKAIVAIILVLFCILIHFYSADVYRVEYGYSLGFYPVISRVLRYAFGWLPCSIGDLLYGLLAVCLVWKLISFIKNVFRSRWRAGFRSSFSQKLLRLVTILSFTYIVFNIFWGINYNRKGIAWQLGLKTERYDTEELKEINCLLLQKINDSKAALVRSHEPYPTNKELVRSVTTAYKALAVQYPYLSYDPVSFKPSMWGWVGNYAGFSGYYNPFTGEAQLNTTIPKFLQPYTACHEAAHQLGYAKEMEANFVGYLAAAASPDTLFHYSVYLDLFNYANRNLYFTDSVSAKLYRKELSPGVVKDLKEWITFSRKHRNPVEPFIRWGYGLFLQSNQQPQGILSYDEVTGFVIAYYKKFHKI